MQALAKIEDIKEETFCSFILSQNEFAIPAKYVQEVVNAPSHYNTIPLSPSYLKGVFNLRGTIIAVIDLNIILNIKPSSTGGSKKIAIIEHNDFNIGLLLDETSEIFKSDESEKSIFDEEQNDPKKIIQGAFKKNNGARILQILDIKKLFEIKNVPKEKKQKKIINHHHKGARQQCISFTIGDAFCALEIGSIREILKDTELQSSALAGDYCVGMLELRGNTVPIINFSKLLGYADTSTLRQNIQKRILVMQIEEGLFGLLVDQVESIVTYFPEQLLEFPIFNKERSEIFMGCISLNNEKNILLLDKNKIFSNEEIHTITHGHSKLYHTKNDLHNVNKKNDMQRKTYITFSLEQHFAVHIQEIKEIIEYPKNIMHPPGLLKVFNGVFNLRGEMITIIDTAMMYHLTSSNIKNKKVLIFKKQQIPFGLIVDSVQEIISFESKDTIALPAMLYQEKNASKIIEDISEAIEITVDEKKHHFLILNVDSIANRLKKLQ